MKRLFPALDEDKMKTQNLAKCQVHPMICLLPCGIALARIAKGLFMPDVIHCMNSDEIVRDGQMQSLRTDGLFQQSASASTDGDILPAKAEANYYASAENIKLTAYDPPKQPSGKSSAIQSDDD